MHVVIKRDKSRQKFNEDKVYNAVLKCFHECPADNHEDVALLIKNNVVELVTTSETEYSVEDIQDAVERMLMELGYYDQAKHYILYRQKRTDLRKRRLKADSRAISEYIHPAKYARFLPEKNRRELYHETVDRVKNMHLEKYPYLKEYIDEAFKFVLDKRVLPSMRSLQFSGKAIKRDNARMFNCSFSYFDRPAFLKEAMYLLLCGTGVGFSVQRQHVDKLPALKHITQDSKVVHHRIDDSKEGWALAFEALFDSYVNGYYVEFDYSGIRDRGKPLVTSGGRAPGHRGLKYSIEKARAQVLDIAQGRKLRPIECHKLICVMVDAILSGGVRRSACISLFSADDDEMIYCKTGEWWKDWPELANSNNSVVLIPGQTSREFFNTIISCTKQWGEPGFFFTDDSEYGVNPCQPGFAFVRTRKGIVEIDYVNKGDEIYSIRDGWVRVVDKVSAGIKPVFVYHTVCGGKIIATEDHKIVLEDGSKVTLKEVYQDKTSYRIVSDCERKNIDADTISHRMMSGNHPVYNLTVDGKHHSYWSGGVEVANCGEALLIPKIEEKTGWGFCNLCEINAAKFTTPEDMLECSRIAAILGTLQAGYTDFNFLSEEAKDSARRDSLLGVSMTGMMESPEISFDSELQKKAAGIIQETNRKIVDIMHQHGENINYAARTTLIKPGGTSSLELGIATTGIHPAHSDRYIRRVTANSSEPVFQYFKSINPHMVVQKPNGDWVIEFPMECKVGTIKTSDLTALEFLERVRSTQENWVNYGTNPESLVEFPGATHGVSNTVTVREHEWEQVEQFIWDNQHCLRGVSLLPDFADKAFEFAPRSSVTTPEDEIRWNALVKDYKPVNYENMVEYNDLTDLQGEIACSGGACELNL